MGRVLDRFGQMLARYLEKPVSGYEPFTPSDRQALATSLKPGDVLLVEGNNHISGVIKYLTQSTWSHSALYIGDALGPPLLGAEPKVLIEADLRAGVHAVPLSHYAGLHTRICRPVGLTPEDQKKVVDFMVNSIGEGYDLRNLVDLARYLLPTPPVPARWRRRMIALGSGDPTRAICSTMIAEAFEQVRYPILPIYRPPVKGNPAGAAEAAAQEELWEIRHHSLYVPRDFDISPYFAIVKPTIAHGFDYRKLRWEASSQ